MSRTLVGRWEGEVGGRGGSKVSPSCVSGEQGTFARYVIVWAQYLRADALHLPCKLLAGR